MTDQGCAILLYHRVNRLRGDPFGLAVRPNRFRAQLDVLRDRFRVVPLAELHAMLAAGEPAPGTLAISFDDGYADNVSALAECASRGLPATLFMTTGLLDGRREQWWNELERLLLTTGRLPASLEVEAGGSRRFDLGADARLGFRAWWRHRNWRAWHEPPTARHHAYVELWKILHALPADERDAALRELAADVDADESGRPSHRMLRRDELLRIAALPGLEIGAHTVSHVSLAQVPVEEQREEIERCKGDLETLLQRDVVSFSYPFGSRDDFDDTTVELVRKAGFARACTNDGCALRPQPDPFALPRTAVMDWDGAIFSARLDAVLAG